MISCLAGDLSVASNDTLIAAVCFSFIAITASGAATLGVTVNVRTPPPVRDDILGRIECMRCGLL